VCDESLDAKSLDGRDLIVDARELAVHRRDARVQVLDPLVESRSQRTVLSESWTDAVLRQGANTGETEAGHQATREEFTPVDRPASQLAE